MEDIQKKMNIDKITPLVSICVPTYNRANHLKRALCKLLSIDYLNFEIIVSDNASSDETESICAQFCKKYPNIRYIRHANNIGMTKNFEYARSMAFGKYFILHGDDDLLDFDLINKCVEELENNQKLVLVSGLAAYHGGDFNILNYGNVIQANFRSPLSRILYYILKVEDNSIFCGVYRRDVLEKCKMHNCLAGDWVWISEILLEGSALVLPSTLIYREKGNTASSSIRSTVAALGLPRWHSVIPWVIRPFNFAYYISVKSNRFNNKNMFFKAIIFIVIFLTALAKQIVHMVLPKLPFGKLIYKRIFLDSVKNK